MALLSWRRRNVDGMREVGLASRKALKEPLAKIAMARNAERNVEDLTRAQRMAIQRQVFVIDSHLMRNDTHTRPTRFKAPTM